MMEIDLTLIALIITSIATVAYATLTYLLLIETRREKKKPIIEEILGVILYPLRQLLFDESSDLEKENARLSFTKGKFRSDWIINKLFSWEPNALVYQDFLKNHAEIAEMINEHDALISDVVAEANKIAEILYNTNFKKKCDELVTKWDESDQQKISNIFSGNQLYEDILTYLINNIKKLNERHLFYEFWKYNHEIFFKEKERLAKKQSENLKNKLKQLEIFTKNFLKKNEKLIDSYQKKYNFAAKFITQKYDLYQKGFL